MLASMNDCAKVVAHKRRNTMNEKIEIPMLFSRELESSCTSGWVTKKYVEWEAPAFISRATGRLCSGDRVCSFGIRPMIECEVFKSGGKSFLAATDIIVDTSDFWNK